MKMYSPLLSPDSPSASQLNTLQSETQILTPGKEDESERFIDSELFIRMTFETDVEKGCDLLFQRYYKPLCNHAVRFVYSKEIAEDIVAEIFCNFWDAKGYLNISMSYRAYLVRSVRNRCFNYLQKEQNRNLPLELASQEEISISNMPERIMQFEDLYHRVDELVRGLPPQCQKVFVMNRFEGKMGKEIADELKISTRTVEVHIAKALSILRNGLKNHWLEVFILAHSTTLINQVQNLTASL